MIAVVRGPLSYGEAFPDAALVSVVLLPLDEEISLGKVCRHLSARS
jgi:hypothetical protein